MNPFSIIRRLLLYKRRKSFNREFAGGRWDNIRDIRELGRFSALAGYVRHFAGDNGSVLELGCGQGVLAEHLLQVPFQYYCGVDFAENAIKLVPIKDNPRFRFVASDIDDFTDDRLYDAIVFSESLYYLLRPLSTLARYGKKLTRDGVFIISIYHIQKNEQLWNNLKAEYRCLDQTTVTNKTEMTWKIGVFAPKTK